MFSDDKIITLSPDALILFIAGLTFADDRGRGRAFPREIGGHAFPAREVDVEALLQELARKHEDGGALIHFYWVKGVRYFHYPNWTRHQRISNPTASRLPSPDDHCACCRAAERAIDEAHGVAAEPVPAPGSVQPAPPVAPVEPAPSAEAPPLATIIDATAVAPSLGVVAGVPQFGGSADAEIRWRMAPERTFQEEVPILEEVFLGRAKAFVQLPAEPKKKLLSWLRHPVADREDAYRWAQAEDWVRSHPFHLALNALTNPGAYPSFRGGNVTRMAPAAAKRAAKVGPTAPPLTAEEKRAKFSTVRQEG